MKLFISKSEVNENKRNLGFMVLTSMQPDAGMRGSLKVSEIDFYTQLDLITHLQKVRVVLLPN